MFPETDGEAAGEEELGAAGGEAAETEAAAAERIIPDDGRVIGITVHRTDKLKTDFNTAHPLVRVSFVDATTGAYLKKQNKYVSPAFLCIQTLSTWPVCRLCCKSRVISTKVSPVILSYVARG